MPSGKVFIEMVGALLQAKRNSQMLGTFRWKRVSPPGVRLNCCSWAWLCLRIDKQRSHRAKIRLSGQSVAQWFEPARPEYGVVVQKKQQFAPGPLRGQIAGRSEAQVRFLAQNREPIPEQFLTQRRAGLQGGVLRCVVHHDHFEEASGSGGPQAVQTLPGQGPLVADRDDDGQERIGGHAGRM